MRFRHQWAIRIGFAASLIVGLGKATPSWGQSRPPRIELKNGSRIAVVGNALAKEMQTHGYLETALHCGHPDLQLLERNFSEFSLEIGALGNLNDRLVAFKPDVVIACFGFNESFAGPDGVAAFRSAAKAFIAAQPAATQLILVSPIPYVRILPSLPDAEVINANLLLYAEALRAACRDSQAIYLDIYSKFEELAEESPEPFTDNGIHLNGFGHWNLSRILIEKLRLTVHSPGSDSESAEAIRQLVLAKNQRWRDTPAEVEASDADRAIWNAEKPSMTSVWAAPPTELASYRVANRPLAFQESTLTRVGFAKEALSVAHGLSLDLWISEEEAPIMHPIQMQFDGRGRLWVLCTSADSEDYIVVLEDVDHDHFADRSMIFARDLVNPTSFAISGDSAYVAEQTALIRYDDRTGNGAADSRTQLLAGFGGGFGGLRWGPGGGLWFGQGHGALTRLETARGPRVVKDGAMFRYDPRRVALDLVSDFDFMESPTPVFDTWGQGLVADAGRGQTYMLNHIAGRKSDADVRSIIPSSFRQNPGGEFLSTRHFPAALRDAYVHHESGDFRGARWYRTWPNGSSIRLEGRQEHVVVSSDLDFDPVDTEVGPDGALYAIDSDGRIWRIGAFGRSEFWRENLSNISIRQLLEQLREFEPSTRQLVRQEIWHRDPKAVISALQTWVDSLAPDDPDRQQLLTEALWLHHAFDAPNEGLLDRLVGSPEPRARAAAADVLGFWAERLAAPLELLRTLIEDPDPRVRLASLQAALRIGTPQAGDIALLATAYPMDLALKAVFDEVTQKLGKAAGKPPGIRAAAIAKSTEDLVKEEMTPIIADVLLARADVPNEHLLRAAAVTARNRNQSLTRFLIDSLADRFIPVSRLRNILALLPKADGWQLHFATTELTMLAETTPSSLAREGAYAGLLLAAATNQTFDRLLEEVKRREDFHYVSMLRGSAHVLAHDGIASLLNAVIRDELAKTNLPTEHTARFVRVISPRASEFRFAEVQAMAGGKNLAQGRPAKQFSAPGRREWWAANARAGTNDVLKAELETAHPPTEGTERPILGVAVYGPAAADEDLWWELDLGGRGAAIEEIVFHPTPRGCETSLVRFELRDARGQLVWRSSRPVHDTKPIHVPVRLERERVAAATVAAKAMGEDFEKKLLATAENDSSMDTRFAAMRALKHMGVTQENLKITAVKMEVSDQLKLAPANISIDPKTPIELTIHNGNGHPLNIAILEPDAEAEIGKLVDSISSGETEDEDGVPDSAKILFASAVIASGESTVLRFVAPTTPGKYPLLSTTPEAWGKMRGTLTVKAPPPPPEPKPEPPAEATD